jgi:hypothetical protein
MTLQLFWLTALSVATLFFSNVHVHAEELTLRRSTTVRLATVSCVQEARAPELRAARALIQRIAAQIMQRNPEVFRGDLEPSQICVVPNLDLGQRAWAETDKRRISIEAGMVLRVQNEAQLAFVIAHELAHVALRHTPLEGNPIPLESRAQANEWLLEHSRLVSSLYDFPKGSPRALAIQARAAELERHTLLLFKQYFGEEFIASWLETEAEVAGAVYYMNAGYPAAELGWRLEQLAVALFRAGRDPRTQHGGGGFDPHSPPGPESSTERLRVAQDACRLSSSISSPIDPLPRGTHRYALSCWQIWNLRFNLPQVSPLYGALYQQALSRVPALDLSTSLHEAKRSLCASPRTRIDLYCGTSP